MRKNLPITGRHLELPEGSYLLSTTDIHSCITYVSPNFVQISGFTTQELIGQPHNIVRHPDMPEAVFAQMWRTLKSGQSWVGVIKNRCHNGDHFWASAYATPIYQNGKITEYQAVLTPASATQIRTAERLYTRLRKHPKSTQVGLSIGIKTKLSLCFMMIWLCCALLTYLAFDSARGSLLVLVIEGISCALCMIVASWLLSPIRWMADQARKIVDNPLSQQVYCGRGDELGQIGLALYMAQFDANDFSEGGYEPEYLTSDNSESEELLQAIAYFRSLQTDTRKTESQLLEP